LVTFARFIFEREETNDAGARSGLGGCTGNSAFRDGLAGFGSTGCLFSPVRGSVLCNFCCSMLGNGSHQHEWAQWRCSS